MRHTGILTGTFDPIHNGHIAIARAAHAKCLFDEVWFWPNPDPAHKLATASYDDRLAMLKLALMDEVSLQAAPVSEISFQRPHTIENFQAVLQPFCDQRFSFIVGMDTLGRLDTWKNFESVVTNTSFIVIHRRESIDVDMNALLQRLGNREKNCE
ncbi:nicotinate-nicotinamide nucleotide adenylyltransferase [bacterium]|nr:MAG: nicotinate-nicotinamide nucleotide adenylyltransferase [bacterium]